MTQFHVYRNASPSGRRRIPYLLDVQTHLLQHLHTCVVAPLALSEVVQGKAAKILNPVFTIEGQEVVMLTPELAGVHRTVLGEFVVSLEEERDSIVAALDFLFTGI